MIFGKSSRNPPASYQEVYPERPLVDSGRVLKAPEDAVLTFEYFETIPSTMRTAVFALHHVLVNLKAGTHKVEHWCDGERFEHFFERNDVIVTPAGLPSAWRWHARSQVAVVTLTSESLRENARTCGSIRTRDWQGDARIVFSDATIALSCERMLSALQEHSPDDAERAFQTEASVFLERLCWMCDQSLAVD